MIMIPGTVVMSATVLDNQIVSEPGPVFTGIWYGAFVSTVLVLSGGVFAGLTLGLMGLDELHLRVLSTSSSNPVEKENATKVLQLMSKGRHWILVVSSQLALLLAVTQPIQVLLLCNVIINETLPIFLDDMTGGGLSAVIISTMAIGGSQIFQPS
ncbi:hypothetical protein H0H93_008514 [Arthromyces matolae]|nr:hypothetical protein H0H93_008514 [Arthromyces matolae]